jgi:iron only hydrogenase large subunit-like protein
MSQPQPIYTEKTKCRDCYKCVRECPVKAIQVTNEVANIMPDRCVYCGNCVSVCPVGAKKLRNDLSRLKLLLRQKERVVVSLAPSFVNEFAGVGAGQLIRAIKKLGFWAVSETALGAEEISKACAAAMDGMDGAGLRISTACPTVVELVRRYHTEYMPDLLPIASPVLAHCKMLKREFGEDVGIVMVGPCIAKKLEADAHPDMLDAALTFIGLKTWFKECGIDPAAETATDQDAFVPRRSKDGALYPIDGGMARSIAYYAKGGGVRYMSFSGIRYLQDALRGIKDACPKHKIFLELLACEGGCVNGPKASKKRGTAIKWLNVTDYAEEPGPGDMSPSGLDFALPTSPLPVSEQRHSQEEIAKALHRVGKTSAEDEINCSGCGYDTCRHFAEALLENRAEPSMCVSYMRNLATNKANALIRSMPAGVALVDESMSIIECNRRFAEIIGGDTLEIYDVNPGMGGAILKKIAPELSASFARGLESETMDLRKDVRVGDRLLRLTVFTVELGRIVGGVLQDITEPAVQREQIIQKAQEVIHKNVATVQQIAFLLGENAAEIEMMLDSLTSSFQLEQSAAGGNALDGDGGGHAN